MSKLHDYSLVEVQLKSYSLHACVQDWSLEFLNRSFDDKLYRLAIRRIGQSVQWETEAGCWVRNRRLLQHVQRLEYTHVKRSIDRSNIAYVTNAGTKVVFCIWPRRLPFSLI
jgi:hypothetical protein